MFPKADLTWMIYPPPSLPPQEKKNWDVNFSEGRFDLGNVSPSTPLKLSKNKMLIFRLHSTSNHQPSNESCPKCKKMAAKSSKNEMLVFGLCSTSDDQPEG